MANEFKIKKGLIVNETDLYVSESKAGVGTTSPDANLHVSGSTSNNRLLQVGSNYLVVTGSNGYVGIGTTSIDNRLHVQGGGMKLEESSGNIDFRLTINGDNKYNIGYQASGDAWGVYHNPGSAYRIYVTGSNGYVGIGNTAPSYPLHVTGKIYSTTEVQGGSFVGKESSGITAIGSNTIAKSIRIGRDTTENDIFITGSNGYVGIGTTSPDHKLTVNGAIRLLGTGTGNNSHILYFTNSAAAIARDANNLELHAYDNLIFGVSNTAYPTSTERMRIDSSGNVMVGKTATGLVNEGAELSATGQLKGTAKNQVVAYLNLSGSDGTIAEFRKDNTAVGSIGTSVGSIYIGGNSDGGIYFNGTTDIRPWNKTTQANLDNSISLGTSAARFNDLYLGGTGYIDGDLTVGGTVTAQEFHTEFVSASIIYQSGSTKFGDTSDDVHQFTGSVSITGSSTFSGALTIDSSTDGKLTLRASSGDTNDWNYINFNGRDNVRDGYVGTNAGGDMVFESDKNSSSVSLLSTGIYLNDNVGIGTDSPSKALDVSGELNVEGGDGYYIDSIGFATFTGGAIGLGDWDGEGYDTRLYSNGGVKIFISSSGNVGIGTTSPSTKLHVSGSGELLRLESALGNGRYLRFNDSSGTKYNFIAGVQQNVDNGFEITPSAATGSSTFSTPAFVVKSDYNVGIGTTTPSQKLTVAGTISGSSDLSIDGNSVFDGTVGYNTFNSGFGGNGWRIDSNANAEFENLTVRGTFSVYELLAQQIRATNGSLLVATSGKVESTGSLTLFFDTGSQYGHGFSPGDILLAQRLDPNGGQLKRTFLTVDTVSSTGSLTYKDLSGNPPEAGQEFVRIGSTSSLDRQGHIYLTADDSNAPYIGVRDGVSGSTQFTSGTGSIEKVRMGKLSGITSNTFGALSGYGLWASGSVYLEGGISATFGDIGGFNITDSAITSSGDLLSLKSNGQITASNALIGGTSKIAGFTVSDTQINSGTNLVLKSSGQITGSNVLFTGGKISGSSLAIDVTTLTAKGNTVEISGSNFHLLNGNITASNVNLSGNISATTGNIGGFAITSDAITGSGFYLSGSATGTGFFISASNFNVKANGQLTASAAQITGNITATTGNIGGFAITSDAITGSGFYLSGSATGGQFFISASNFNVKANGQLTASAALIGGTSKIAGFTVSSTQINDSGNNLLLKSSGEITASAGLIGGWVIDSTSLSKLTPGVGDGIKIDSSNNLITVSSDSPAEVVRIGELRSSVYGIEAKDWSGATKIFHVEADGSTVSGSIAGFQFSTTQINDSSGTNLILKSNGQITASAAFIGGTSKIAGFSISDSQINSGTDLVLKSNGQITASNAILSGSLYATELNLLIGSNTELYSFVPWFADTGSLSLISDGTDFAVYLNGGSFIASSDTYLIAESRLGVGLQNPSTDFHVSSSNNTTPVRIQIGSNANYYFSANSTSGYATTFNMDNTGLDIGHNSSTRALNLQTNSQDRLTILGGGNVGIGTTSPAEKLTIQGNISASGDLILSNGKGIDFSATSNSLTGSMTSELLDDYEEGTWSPIFSSIDIDQITMSIQNAHYTRVGNLVTISAYFWTTNLTTFSIGAESLSIKGLPFTPVANDYFAISVGYVATWSGGLYPSGGYIQNISSNPEIVLTYRSTSSGATTQLTDDALSYGSGNRNRIMLSAIYYT